MSGPVLPPTDRQLEILSTIAGAGAGKMAARELEITLYTLRTHTQRARRRLGAHDTPHAVALAIRAGLLGWDADAGAWHPVTHTEPGG